MTTLPDPLPRCCSAHLDWTTLQEHLHTDFTELDPAVVDLVLVEVKTTTSVFALGDADAIEMGELAVRNRLREQLQPNVPTPRLDPESRRSRQANPRRTIE